jgi:hypothetical protein
MEKYWALIFKAPKTLRESFSRSINSQGRERERERERERKAIFMVSKGLR